MGGGDAVITPSLSGHVVVGGGGESAEVVRGGGAWTTHTHPRNDGGNDRDTTPVLAGPAEVSPNATPKQKPSGAAAAAAATEAAVVVAVGEDEIEEFSFFSASSIEDMKKTDDAAEEERIKVRTAQPSCSHRTCVACVCVCVCVWAGVCVRACFTCTLLTTCALTHRVLCAR
jgi:hypothetical protein